MIYSCRIRRELCALGCSGHLCGCCPPHNPVQFTKILAGLLFVITAGFLFGMALQFRDDLTPVFIGSPFASWAASWTRFRGGSPRASVFLCSRHIFFLGPEQPRGRGSRHIPSVFAQSLYFPALCSHSRDVSGLQHWKDRSASV